MNNNRAHHFPRILSEKLLITFHWPKRTSHDGYIACVKKIVITDLVSTYLGMHGVVKGPSTMANSCIYS